MKIKIAAKHYYLTPIYLALKSISVRENFEVDNIEHEISGVVYIDDLLVGYILINDYYAINKGQWEFIEAFNPRIIFKYQYGIQEDYTKRLNIISGGYVSPALYGLIHDKNKEIKTDLNRDVDVTARMRDYQGNPNRKNNPWCIGRKDVKEQAQALKTKGYNAVTTKIPVEEYFEELPRCKVGFNWGGCGNGSPINFRVIEYLCYGVVMLTQPFGKEHPIREDITLEDNVTAVFCDKPESFYAEAELLLKDTNKIKRIRKNCIELYNEKLRPEKMGEWYYNKLKGAIR